MPDEREGSVSYANDRTANANTRAAIESAEGMALGPDGYFHPLEGDEYGNLQQVDKTTNQLLELLIEEIQGLRLDIQSL